jgi:Ni,Fe-hydrogenase maturation factor
LIRIICIGNRFAYPDSFGMLVYDELKKLELKDIEVVEGGVGGSSLISYFEDDKKILIVDYGSKDMKKILTDTDIQNLNIDEYNHANSFLYLLKTVKKEYTIYICNRDFTNSEIPAYTEEILKTAMEL